MRSVRIRHALHRVALLALAAFALHQLRYLVGYDGEASGALARQGHGYLAAILPDLIGASFVLVLASFVAALLERSPATATPDSFRREWLNCALALVGIFVIQELAEAGLNPGHPNGLAAVAGAGGWVTLPLAILFGAAVALLTRFLRSLDQVLASVGERRIIPRRPCDAPRPAERHVYCRSSIGLAFGFARRPPPEAFGRLI